MNPTPTLAGFLDFVRTLAGVPVSALPDDSTALTDSFAVAMETVNTALAWAAPVTYVLAVYNLGTSLLINFAPDQQGQTFFSALRAKFDLNGPVLGPLTSTSDEGTSVSVAVPAFVDQLSLSEMSLLKEPFGRRYVALAQKAGSVWGIA